MSRRIDVYFKKKLLRKTGQKMMALLQVNFIETDHKIIKLGTKMSADITFN